MVKASESHFISRINLFCDSTQSGKALATLAEGLLQLGFSAIDELGFSVTYMGADDTLKIHLDPDGSFTAFGGSDEVIAEGNSAPALNEILVVKSVIAGRLNAPTRGPVWSRHQARVSGSATTIDEPSIAPPSQPYYLIGHLRSAAPMEALTQPG